MKTSPPRALPRLTSKSRPACFSIGLLLCIVWAVPTLATAATPGITSFRDDRVQEPRRLWLRGRYAEAEAACRKLLDRTPAAAVLLARCQHEQSQRQAWRATLAEAIKLHQSDAESRAMLRAEQAWLALSESDLELATDAAASAAGADEPLSRITAQFVSAELDRAAGKLGQADEKYGAIIARVADDWANADPETMLFITRAALALAQRQGGAARFRTIVNKMLRAIEKREPEYWPAMHLSAQVFAEKFNYAQAKTELDRALAINPNAVATLASLGQTAVERYDIARAQAASQRIRRIAPESADADLLDAQVDLLQWNYTQAAVSLQRAAAKRPNDRVRGMWTAALWAQAGSHEGPPADALALMHETIARNPRCGGYFAEIGKQLDAMRKYPHAVSMLRRAIEVDPKRIGPRAQLGLLLMRLGEESEAAKLLNESFKIDPFNVRVKNMLEVLDVLKDYAVIETEHFVIRFDRGVDGVLAKCAAKQLEESIYPAVTRELGFEPQGKTLFEVFSNRGASAHSLFSARMSGLPFIGTVGACAGKMVAFTSPNSVRQKFNWAQLLKHEFVHVVNLQQSNFHVPHWFTEAMAVRIERPNRPPEWDDLLARRYRSGRLFNLDTINLGFIRPKNSDDWTLAYCQSELYLNYLIAEHGEDAGLKLLAAFAQNETVGGALVSALDTDKETVETGYLRYVESIVENVPPIAAPEPSLAEATERATGEPDNPETQAALALALLNSNRKSEARRAALAALKLRDNHPDGQYVMARLEMSIGDDESAEERLEAALETDAPNENVLVLLAALRMKQERWSDAVDLFEVGSQRFPHPTRWRKQLARAYLKSKNAKALRRVLGELADKEPTNLLYLRKLIQMAEADGDHEAVVKWTNQCLEVDVMDADHHAAKGAAHLQLKQPALAVHNLRIATQLSPERIGWRIQLVQALAESDQLDQAKELAAKLLEDAPENAEVQQALRKLKQ